METFAPGSATHLVTLAVSALAVAGFVLLGRRLAVGGEVRLRRGWALGIFVVTGLLLARLFQPATFDARWSLPLHLCDVAFLLAGVALWSERRGLVAVTYFWALGLSTQAFVTPIVRLGPAHLEFWAFWLYHVQLVGAAVYLVAARGFRPTHRDLLVALGATGVYVLVVLPLDIAFDWSYGFLGPDDALGRGTLLEWLPPWPMRLCVMFALTAGGMTLLWLVWLPFRSREGES